MQPHNESALPIALKTANEAMMLSLYATLGIFLLLPAGITRKLELEVSGSTVFKSGVVLLSYRPMRMRTST